MHLFISTSRLKTLSVVSAMFKTIQTLQEIAKYNYK